MNLDPTSAFSAGMGVGSFVLGIVQVINNWRNRSVGVQKDETRKVEAAGIKETVELRMDSLEKQNEKQNQVLDLQTNLLYEMRADFRGRFDRVEGDVKNLSDRQTAIETRK